MYVLKNYPNFQYAFGEGYIHDDLQAELETWRKNFVDATAADDQLRAMESRTAMLRNEVDRLQSNVKVRLSPLVLKPWWQQVYVTESYKWKTSIPTGSGEETKPHRKREEQTKRQSQRVSRKSSWTTGCSWEITGFTIKVFIVSHVQFVILLMIFLHIHIVIKMFSLNCRRSVRIQRNRMKIKAV